MIRSKLEKYMAQRKCTLLGVGPMSLNCVDATIELASEYDTPLMLIASRRQVDSEQFGGGYVNHWGTQEYGRYVQHHDKKGKVILARDHGGPWQNTKEVEEEMSLPRAMQSAKDSYLADIEADFKILHIDPSIDIHGSPTTDEILDRIFELYEYCWAESQKRGKEIIFEIGTEEQSGGTNTQEELSYTLDAMLQFCKKNGLPSPTFVVIQTGTKVMESRNIGSFDAPIRIANELAAEIQIPKMIETCERFGVMMKEHNTDYLSDEALQWHPRLGIHAANVAPEFGVAESKALVELLKETGLHASADRFLEISYESGKWRKWMVHNTTATDYDSSIIAGHYVFSDPRIVELKEGASVELTKKGIDLTEHLKLAVKASILRYMKNFRLCA